MAYAKLLICDDHPAIRRVVNQIAKEVDKDIEVVEAETAVDAIALLEKHPKIDLVLLDLHMPGMSGLDLLSELKLRYPSVPAVVLSSDETRATIIDALERGATGYICKSSPTDLLSKYLEHALKGQIALPIAIVSGPKPGPAGVGWPLPNAQHGADKIDLSPRQTDVLNCLLRGMSNKQICGDLNLSEGTVKSHVFAIFRALNVNSRAQAVIEASRRGLHVRGRRA
jgi:DNA-binding NarL/FixJ family response regulator